MQRNQGSIPLKSLEIGTISQTVPSNRIGVGRHITIRTKAMDFAKKGNQIDATIARVAEFDKYLKGT